MNHFLFSNIYATRRYFDNTKLFRHLKKQPEREIKCKIVTNMAENE